MLGGMGGPQYPLPLPVQGGGHRGAQWGAHGQAPSLGTPSQHDCNARTALPLVPVGSGWAYGGWGTSCPATPSTPWLAGIVPMLYIV